MWRELLITTDKTGRRSSNYLLVFIKKLVVIRSKENNKLDKFQTTDVLRLETLKSLIREDDVLSPKLSSTRS